MWGYKHFFKRAVLETFDYIKHDTLALTCTVGFVSSTQGQKVYSIPVPKPNIGLHFAELLENGLRSDITFEVVGELSPAHKLLFAARSSVFNDQFFGAMCEKDSEVIHVRDIKPPVFKVMLYLKISDGFEHLRENCPSLECELLKVVTGVENDFERKVPVAINVSKKTPLDAPAMDGSDVTGSRVRPRT
ncbi:hypothetical protein KP509_26G031100 [Ceratopteris richardii]|uniref:BTB domain-containing protein n=1 Tax=Ceratopteris richardii TaxID=49495 RepID=A0A8T2RJD9_CERRI|nr:hypothetical protein KP509_26G031100 [Ceratopteris richardii]